jgi:hypothetical protein
MAFGTFLGTKEPFPLDGYQETTQSVLVKVYFSRAFLASKFNFIFSCTHCENSSVENEASFDRPRGDRLT